ncbi:hypothetical protein LPJ61_004243, partial [Coemansia biformis]
ASLWLSRLVQSLLVAAGETHERLYETPDYVIIADEVGCRQHSLQQLARLLAGAHGDWDGAKRERMWVDAFSMCCADDRVALVEYLIPALDECGWAQLEKHSLAEDHGVLLVLHLLGGWDSAGRAVPCNDKAGIEQLLSAVLGDAVLAETMLDDVARLVLETRDCRVVDMWRRLWRGRSGATRLAKAPGGRGGENVAELFGRAGACQLGVDEEEIDIAQTRLFRQWRCITDAQARGSPSELLRIWLGAAAAADDDGLAFRVLDRHFGGATAAGAAAAQMVVRREAALDVAAFMWAPLGWGEPAAARDDVLAQWRAGGGGGGQ